MTTRPQPPQPLVSELAGGIGDHVMYYLDDHKMIYKSITWLTPKIILFLLFVYASYIRQQYLDEFNQRQP